MADTERRKWHEGTEDGDLCLSFVEVCVHQNVLLQLIIPSISHYAMSQESTAPLTELPGSERSLTFQYAKTPTVNLLYIYHILISLIPFLPLELLSLHVWLSNITK